MGHDSSPLSELGSALLVNAQQDHRPTFRTNSRVHTVANLRSTSVRSVIRCQGNPHFAVHTVDRRGPSVPGFAPKPSRGRKPCERVLLSLKGLGRKAVFRAVDKAAFRALRARRRRACGHPSHPALGCAATPIMLRGLTALLEPGAAHNDGDPKGRSAAFSGAFRRHPEADQHFVYSAGVAP
uniref:Uncharacterized protein n=1 Tax=Nonomuraea gerenzanensis TaxID=93944 RepID=A0A1M4EFW8_9ACTN|nr:hypothetical protein BN4615_P7200 [Nonomuraea gerenzanensis]